MYTAATNMLQPADLLERCQDELADCSFQATDSFYWSPQTKTIYFEPRSLDAPKGQMALLHEVSHATLRHIRYGSDAELLALEVTAWQHAAKQASAWSMDVIDPDHIQTCLDTYRDWLYARSSCPTCAVNSLQTAPLQYTCLNCLTTWNVSPSRFCRPYRMQLRGKKIPPREAQAVFQ